MNTNVRKERVPLPGLKPKPRALMTDANHQREFIRNFSFNDCKLGNQGFQRLLIQLFGYAGNGKSSFINTCKVVWENSAYCNHTKASGSYGGDTKDRRTYQLTENIILVDNRGCIKMQNYEKGEVFAQLGNLMPLNMMVNWSQGFKLADRIVESEPIVKSSDFIAPIFVCKVGFSPNPEEFLELKEILKTCREMTGVEATVVLTHKMKGDLGRTEAMFKDLGITHVFSLENYTPEKHSRSSEVHNSVMQFLYEVVQDVKFRVDQPRDPQREMMERKIFVLNYIHNNELETNAQKLERQRAIENAKIDQTMRARREEAEKQRQKEGKEHEERIRELEEEFERHRLRDQFEHEQKMKNNNKRKSKGK